MFVKIGQWNGVCVLAPVARNAVSLFFLPELPWLSISAFIRDQSLAEDTGLDSDRDGDPEITTFVDQLLTEESLPSMDASMPSNEFFMKGEILKSNFAEKKRKFSSYHWDLLRNW